MDYLFLKHIHMGCAALSVGLFALRGGWMLQGSAMLRRRWVRTLPHLVDSLLLASAVGLAAWSGQYPGAQPWLSAKVAALLVYIVLGSVALKRGRSRAIRSAALAGALATVAYIGAVAFTRNPLLFL